MSYLKIMFWLFKRKKVADKKAITPCVCDNGDTIPDSLTLQDFGTPGHQDYPKSNNPAPQQQQKTPGHRGGGYQRLEPGSSGPSSEPDPIPPLTSYCRMSCNEDSSESSSEEDEDDEREDAYFEGFTDTEDEEEELTCNFCERSFHSVRTLEKHQQRKRHYMCSVCDTAFDGLMLLEAHKEALDHWSDYELRVRRATTTRDEDEEEEDEEDEYRGRKSGDELKRLLL